MSTTRKVKRGVPEEPASIQAVEQREEAFKKAQTEAEEWLNKVREDALVAAGEESGDLDVARKVGVEVRLKQISEEVTRRAQELRRRFRGTQK